MQQSPRPIMSALKCDFRRYIRTTHFQLYTPIYTCSEHSICVFMYFSKTCLKRPLKIDKTKVLMENGSLMEAESIILLTCIK